MIPLEELLKAPLLPENLPPFEIIKECQKVEEIKIINETGSDSGEEEDNDSDDEAEEVFPCDCGYDERSSNFEGQACGPTANCINRELFIECNAEECPCKSRCQNQRFQKRMYSNVKVVETPGKGFGLFTCEDLKGGSLVMEYVGEIVNQEEMGRRAEKYSKQGQGHFYFMTLRPNQIIDATCKGNLSRFLNHSCAPNCETQKWIVGGKIKIGLFTLKNIKAGTELTFDYKFVRFGKEPQRCLCGEPNCTGFIGVSSLENNKIGRKQRETQEEQFSYEKSEEEIDDFERFMEQNPKSAELPGQISLIVTKLIQTDDLELIKKLLKILESSSKYLCKRKFLNLHGLKLLSTLFSEHSKDQELILSILNILKELPLNTKNLIEDSGWFEKLKMIQEENEENVFICESLKELEAQWNNLEQNSKIIPKEGQENSKSKEKEMGSSNTSVPVLMSVPSEFSSALHRKRQQWAFEDDSQGPRSGLKSPRQSSPDSSQSRSPVKTTMIPDPMWLTAKAPDGRTYYYHSVSRETAWEAPMISKDLESRDARDARDARRGDSIYTKDTRSHKGYRDSKDVSNNDSRDYREHDRDYRDSRGSREHNRDSREHNRDYREHSRDYKDSRDSRDYRDRSSKLYPNSLSQSNTTNSALLEGVGDSSQISAIIERAKARRAQDEISIKSEGSPFDLSPSPELHNDSLNNNNNSTTGSTSSGSKKYYSKLKEEVSGVVIRFFSHYRTDLGADFKELARKYTHKIIEKELKELKVSSPPTTDSPTLTSKKKLKIKIYLAEVIKGRKIQLSSEHESISK